MGATVSSLWLLSLLIISNYVKSQSINDTNQTIPTTTNPIITTQFFTTIDSSTGNPTSEPTLEPTPIPTYFPTLDGCSALHGYVKGDIVGNSDQQYSSYPVNYAPYQYRLDNELLFVLMGLEKAIDPCNISSIINEFNPTNIFGNVVGLDASSSSNYNPVLGDCNYQQWTLNMESLGAKGVIIGVDKPFVNYDGDNSLSTPRIPTRFIDIGDLFTFSTSEQVGSTQVFITLDCFNNDYPALICIEDSNNGKDDIWRINGNYEQQENVDDNGHPYWIQDSIYNIGSIHSWILRFELDSTYFNWVISSDFSTNSIVAYCIDHILTADYDPSDCTNWYQKEFPPSIDFNSSDILISSDLCPAPDPNANSTNYCIKSTADSLKNYVGTYTQLIEGIPEWFNDNTKGGEVAYLYWSDAVEIPFSDTTGYGWIIQTGSYQRAICLYSQNQDPSIINPNIRYRPQLCNNWKENTNTAFDTSFDIDGNICESDIGSNVTLICVTYQPEDDGLYSEWSGSYDINIDNVTINNLQIWTFIYNGNDYNILYDEIGDQWVITKNIDIIENDDYLEIEDDTIIASCSDKKGLGSNPMKCSGEWIVNNTINNQIEISLKTIESINECEAPITIDPTNNDGKGDSGKSFIDSFSVGEYVAIGAALLAFPLCIVCFVCYQRRKEKRKNTDETDGISLQPYVPTGMAYDSYKQNQSHKEVKYIYTECKDKYDYVLCKKAKKRSSTKIKKPGPTTVTSASGSIDEEPEEINSRNALINVFDEDGPNHQQTTPIGDDEDDANPFLNDEIIKTGQTLIDDEGPLGTDEVMSAFDE